MAPSLATLTTIYRWVLSVGRSKYISPTVRKHRVALLCDTWILDPP